MTAAGWPSYPEPLVSGEALRTQIIASHAQGYTVLLRCMDYTREAPSAAVTAERPGEINTGNSAPASPCKWNPQKYHYECWRDVRVR
jgi:hypothetical protein